MSSGVSLTPNMPRSSVSPMTPSVRLRPRPDLPCGKAPRLAPGRFGMRSGAFYASAPMASLRASRELRRRPARSSRSRRSTSPPSRNGRRLGGISGSTATSSLPSGQQERRTLKTLLVRSMPPMRRPSRPSSAHGYIWTRLRHRWCIRLYETYIWRVGTRFQSGVTPCASTWCSSRTIRMGMRQAIDNAAPALQRNNIVAEAKAIFSRLRASGDLPADTYGETFFSSWLTRAREHQMGMADLKVYGNRTEWALGTADEAVMKVLDQTASEIGATRQGVMDALLGAAGDGTLRVEGGTYQFNVVRGHTSKLEGQWLPEQPYFQLDQITAVSRRRGAGTEAVRELLLEAQRRGKTQMTTTLQSDLGQPFFESLVKKGWLKPAGEVRLPPGGEGIELKPLPLYDINYDAIKAAEQGEFFWNAMPDVDGVLKRPRPDIEGMHELWYSRGSQALNSIVDATVEQGSKKALKFSGLGADEQRAVRGYAAAVKSNLSSQRYQMSKFGEWTRDSALLNYQRRMNYNTWLGVLMPYEFWATTTIRKWALHSLDRPFMATTYMRMQRMLDQGFRPESGLPARMRHTIRIKAPFLPEFLGNELFIDPLGAALPFSA